MEEQAQAVPADGSGPTADSIELSFQRYVEYHAGCGVYTEVAAERLRAHRKHRAANHSSEQLAGDHRDWLSILGEEYGEVCRALNYDTNDGGIPHLRKELIQVAAMACAWVDALDRLNV